jgi:glycosyltransferase involved in cell wall biosynthesis
MTPSAIPETKRGGSSGLHREARAADFVITLSRHVAGQLRDRGLVPTERTAQLFLPDLSYGTRNAVRTRPDRCPLKLLFFGRILKYKGLSLLLDALEMLRAEGIAIELGVVGAGDLGAERARLEALGAEIINRWIADDEIGSLLARYEAMVLPHIECSQSAVAATAFGSGMPVVGMPVGGIAEQIIDGRTGVLAQQVTARSLADAVRKLATDAGLYRAISSHLQATSERRSMHRFLGAVLHEIARLRPDSLGAAPAQSNVPLGIPGFGRCSPAD